MHSVYEVGFKDVYPWIWSVIFGVALMLAERRGSFLPGGTRSSIDVWTKTLTAVLINVALPATLFGLTMVRLGPIYDANMDFWQVLGALYLATTPLGSHHLWLLIAEHRGWMSEDTLSEGEKSARQYASGAHAIWAMIALGIPAMAAIFHIRLPW